MYRKSKSKIRRKRSTQRRNENEIPNLELTGLVILSLLFAFIILWQLRSIVDASDLITTMIIVADV